MNNITASEEILKNIDSPFTELFSILKRYQASTVVGMSMAYSQEELKIMRCHTDNAMQVLILGMQDLGQLIRISAANKEGINASMISIGILISAVANLVEALMVLQSDTDYSLNKGPLHNSDVPLVNDNLKIDAY